MAAFNCCKLKLYLTFSKVSSTIRRIVNNFLDNNSNMRDASERTEKFSKRYLVLVSNVDEYVNGKVPSKTKIFFVSFARLIIIINLLRFMIPLLFNKDKVKIIIMDFTI